MVHSIFEVVLAKFYVSVHSVTDGPLRGMTKGGKRNKKIKNELQKFPLCSRRCILMQIKISLAFDFASRINFTPQKVLFVTRYGYKCRWWHGSLSSNSNGPQNDIKLYDQMQLTFLTQAQRAKNTHFIAHLNLGVGRRLMFPCYSAPFITLHSFKMHFSIWSVDLVNQMRKYF